MGMTLDEAIKHCEEVAGEQQEIADSADMVAVLDGLDVGACYQCAADHRQLAEWLRELKELRKSVGAFKLAQMKDALNLISDLRQHLFSSEKDLKEAKRLLKLAVDDMKNLNICSEICCRDSFACRVSDTCDFKWRYVDEVEKFLQKADINDKEG